MLQAIKYSRGSLRILDQVKLPHETVYLEINDSNDGFEAIKHMVVRGAPAIAIVAALSLAVEIEGKARVSQEEIYRKLDKLVTARPTAVNLLDAAKKLKLVVKGSKDVKESYLAAAQEMLEEDVRTNQRIGKLGAQWLLKASRNQKIAVITHCNTGSLATAGYGTALGIIRSLFESSSLIHAYCTETRPYNQGSRLTAYELVHDKIPATLITDSMAGALMALRKEVKAVIVGADRVVANGDTANKIGTYSVSTILERH